jgi:hypothetical protein
MLAAHCAGWRLEPTPARGPLTGFKPALRTNGSLPERKVGDSNPGDASYVVRRFQRRPSTGRSPSRRLRLQRIADALTKLRYNPMVPTQGIEPRSQAS